MFLCFECGKRPRKIKHRIIGVCFSVLRFFFSFFSVFFAFIPDSSPFDGMITKCMATVTTFNARKLHFHSISKKYFSTFVLSCIYCPHIYPYRVVYFVPSTWLSIRFSLVRCVHVSSMEWEKDVDLSRSIYILVMV